MVAWWIQPAAGVVVGACDVDGCDVRARDVVGCVVGADLCDAGALLDGFTVLPVVDSAVGVALSDDATGSGPAEADGVGDGTVTVVVLCDVAASSATPLPAVD